jgi:hypothetical protein
MRMKSIAMGDPLWGFDPGVGKRVGQAETAIGQPTELGIWGQSATLPAPCLIP